MPCSGGEVGKVGYVGRGPAIHDEICEALALHWARQRSRCLGDEKSHENGLRIGCRKIGLLSTSNAERHCEAGRDPGVCVNDQKN